MTGEDEYDLEFLTSLLDDDNFEIKESNNAPPENPSPSCDITSTALNAVTSAQCSDAKVNDKDLEQELKELEERVLLLRKQLQKKKDSQAADATQALPDSKNNGQILRPFDINAEFFGSTKPKTATNSEISQQTSQLKNVDMQEKTVTCKDDGDSSDDEGNPLGSKYNEFGQFVRKRLAHPNPSGYESKSKDAKQWSKKIITQSNVARVSVGANELTKSATHKNDEKFATDPYSGIRIINPIVSFIELQNRMVGRRMIKMSCIRMQMRSSDIEGDWVTIGVLINKSNSKKSCKGNSYSIWKLCDLKDCNKAVTLFLFGKTHTEHWKNSVGSVFGILNPTFMSDKDSMNKRSASELSLTVDNPQKIMLMGRSKDYGTCRGRRKDGTTCTMVVNTADCEFCTFHVQAQYKKSSAKRMDLQASYSGPEPSGLRAKILQKQQVMYGGQLFMSSGPNKGKSSATKIKDKLTLASLKLQSKAAEMLKTEKAAIAAARLLTSGTDNVKSERIHTTQSVGSLNFTRPANDSKDKVSEGASVKSITTKELLKLQIAELNAKRTCGNVKPSDMSTGISLNAYDIGNSIPKLGKGLGPGDFIDLQLDLKRIRTDMAKAKAIQKIQLKGHLQKDNPNEVRKNRTSPQFQEKIKKRLATELGMDKETDEPSAKKAYKEIDVTSDDFQNILNRKSKYEYLVNEEESKREEKYFNELEKKEQLETKMSTTMEVPCKAVSCKKCKYTAFAALDTCRSENHPLLVHNTVKRFFKCKDCQRRTVSVSKLPTKPCSGCGGSCYERVAMWKERAGPKMSRDELSLRGSELKFLNATLNSSNLNLSLDF